MFKKTRMLLSIVCVAALLLQAVPVFALDIPFDLEALGITAGIDMDREPDSLVRRDEFAQMTVQLLGYGGVTAADEPAFADIEGSAYKNAILLLRQMNLVSGTSDSSFNPDQYIRYTEACKILVDALGYSPMLSEPTLENYAFVAGSIGLTKGVDGSAEYISMDGVLRMLYNALDINRMTRVLQNGAVVSYEISEGNTLRRQLMRGTTELQKLEGVVTADRSTYLYAELPALKPTQLEIDGKVFDFDGVAPVGLVGQSVELFVKTVGDYQVITSMQAADSNTIASFHTDDLTSAADNVIRIEPEDQPKQSLRVGADTIYIYNGRPERDYAVQSLSALEDAEVRLIDNNEDEVYDVVFITKYSDGIVERVYSEECRVYFKDGYRLDGDKYIDLDPAEQYTYITLTDANGAAAAFEDIQPGMVLSVARSKNGEVRCAVLGAGTVEGAIEQRDDDFVWIDGTAYAYNVAANDLQPGKTVTAKLNFKKQVVMVEYAASDSNYAYVYRCGSGATALSAPLAKLLIPATVSVRTTVEVDEDGGDSTTSRRLFCRNEDVVVYEFASKVRVETTDAAGVKHAQSLDGKAAAATLLNQVISYKLDGDGKLSYAEILNPVTDLQNKTYNSSQQIFGKTSGIAFGITNDVTRSICLPEDTGDEPDENDLTVYTELLNNTSYKVQGYVFDEDTYLCDLIIVNKQLIAGAPGNVTNQSDVGLVTKQASVLDEETGEEQIQITMLTADGEQEFVVSNLIAARDSFLQLTAGDLIAYSLDTFEDLNGYVLLQGHDGYDDFSRTEDSFTKFCGVVRDIKYNYPSAKRNMWVTTLYAGHESDSSASSSFDVIKSNPAPIFLIEENTCSKITVDDIQFGDRIFVAAAVDSVRAVAVKR